VAEQGLQRRALGCKPSLPRGEKADTNYAAAAKAFTLGTLAWEVLQAAPCMSPAFTSLCRHTGRYTAYVAEGTLAQSPAKSSLQVCFAQMCAVQRQKCRGLVVRAAVRAPRLILCLLGAGTAVWDCERTLAPGNSERSAARASCSRCSQRPQSTTESRAARYSRASAYLSTQGRGLGAGRLQADQPATHAT